MFNHLKGRRLNWLHFAILVYSVIFVNENENGEKWGNNEFVNEK